MSALAAIPRLSAADLELSARRVVEGLYAGRHRSPFTGSAVEFRDHRAYQPGDDLRAVDWKAFARSDHLLVRRYQEERDLPVVLLLDTSASLDFGTPTKADWCAQAAAALALLVIDQGDRVRVAAGAAELVVLTSNAGGPAAMPALTKVLAGLTPAGRGDLPALLSGLAARLERRALIVLLSDLLTEATALAQPLAALTGRGHDLAVVQVLDRSEVSLPTDWGRSRFTDPEGVVAELTSDTALAKPGYDAAMAAHLEACRQVCAGCRCDHQLALTDEQVGESLGRWLARRQGRRT